MTYNKWWKLGTDTCPKSDGDRSKASSLNVVNIGGVFVVLFCGLVFALLVAVVEFCFKLRGDSSRHPSIKHRDSHPNGQSKSSLSLFLGGFVPMFYPKDNASNVTECSSCQSLAPGTNRVRYT